MDSVSFGTWLRRQREIRSITLREIADHTKISVRYLEALEKDNFEILPGAVFTKGFLKEYARYVGLDPDEVVNSYLTAQQPGTPSEEQSKTARTGRAGAEWTWGVLLAAIIVVLLALVALVAFYAERRSDAGAESPPAMAAPALEVAPPPLALPEDLEPPSPLTVTLEFVEDCWVEAIVDGRREVSELRVTGESLQLEAEELVVLTVGNSRGVRVEVNGQPYPLPEAGSSSVSREIEISLEALDRLDAEVE